MEETKFVIREEGAFGNLYLLQFDGLHLWFEGTGRHEGQLRRKHLPRASDLDRFSSALKLLAVKNWLPSYECPYTDDGEDWSFRGSILGETYCVTGRNAYPSFADPKVSSDTRDRWSLFIDAAEVSLFNCLPFFPKA